MTVWIFVASIMVLGQPVEIPMSIPHAFATRAVCEQAIVTEPTLKCIEIKVVER